MRAGEFDAVLTGHLAGSIELSSGNDTPTGLPSALRLDVDIHLGRLRIAALPSSGGKRLPHDVKEHCPFPGDRIFTVAQRDCVEAPLARRRRIPPTPFLRHPRFDGHGTYLRGFLQTNVAYRRDIEPAETGDAPFEDARKNLPVRNESLGMGVVACPSSRHPDCRT